MRSFLTPMSRDLATLDGFRRSPVNLVDDRALISAKQKGKDGLPLFKWGDIDVALREHVRKGLQRERRSIANDCFSMAMKVDHYNTMHPAEEPFQIAFNFEGDGEEMKIAKGIDDDDAA